MQIIQDLLRQFLRKEPFIAKVKKIYDFMFTINPETSLLSTAKENRNF